jgi:hypothetical protein
MSHVLGTRARVQCTHLDIVKLMAEVVVGSKSQGAHTSSVLEPTVGSRYGQTEGETGGG